MPNVGSDLTVLTRCQDSVCLDLVQVARVSVLSNTAGIICCSRYLFLPEQLSSASQTFVVLSSNHCLKLDFIIMLF